MHTSRFPERASRSQSSRSRRAAWLAISAAALTLPGACLAQVPVFAPPVALDRAAKTDSHSDESPRIAVGVGGVWVVTWEVVGAGDLGLGRDVDVVYSRSSDDGAHWSAPKPLSENFRSDRAEDHQPAVTTDGKGTWIIVWTSTADLTGGSKRDRDIHLSVSTDNALTWSAPRALHGNAANDWGDDEHPDIATNAKGDWVAVWQSSDSLGNTIGGDDDILLAVSKDNGKSWSDPRVVDASAAGDMGFDTSPRIAPGEGGVWLLSWSSGGASEDRGGLQRGVLVARSEDGAASWSPPQSLSGSSEDDRPDWGPRLATGGKREWLCVWSSSDDLGKTIARDRDILFARSTDDGKTWSERSPLNHEAATDSGDDATPELSVDDAGNWLVVWTSWDRRGAARGADADLMMAMSRDAGKSWTESYILNTNAKTDRGEDITPSVATDGSGLWITAWSSTESFGDVLARDRDVQIAIGRFGHEEAGPPPAP